MVFGFYDFDFDKECSMHGGRAGRPGPTGCSQVPLVPLVPLADRPGPTTLAATATGADLTRRNKYR